MRSMKIEFTATAKNERTRKRLPKRLRLIRKSGALSTITVTPTGSAGAKKLMTCAIPVKPPSVSSFGA